MIANKDDTLKEVDLPATMGATNDPFALLLISRQIYKETHLLPYALNTFHCTNLWDLSICLRRLTPAQRGAIQTFKLRWYTGECMMCEKYHLVREIRPGKDVVMLTGLERLVVGTRPEEITAEIKRKSYWGEQRHEKDCRDVERDLGTWIGTARGKKGKVVVVVEVER
jgi:hypothetical protein